MRLAVALAVAAAASSATAFTVAGFKGGQCDSDKQVLAAGTTMAIPPGLGLIDGVSLSAQSYCVDVSGMTISSNPPLSVAVGLRDETGEKTVRSIRLFTDTACTVALVAGYTVAKAEQAQCVNILGVAPKVCACLGAVVATNGATQYVVRADCC